MNADKPATRAQRWTVKVDWQPCDDDHLRQVSREIHKGWTAVRRDSTLAGFFADLTHSLTGELLRRNAVRRGERGAGEEQPIELRRVTAEELPELLRWLRHIGREVPRAANVITEIVRVVAQGEMNFDAGAGAGGPGAA